MNVSVHCGYENRAAGSTFDGRLAAADRRDTWRRDSIRMGAQDAGAREFTAVCKSPGEPDVCSLRRQHRPRRGCALQEVHGRRTQRDALMALALVIILGVLVVLWAIGFGWMIRGLVDAPVRQRAEKLASHDAYAEAVASGRIPAGTSFVEWLYYRGVKW